MRARTAVAGGLAVLLSVLAVGFWQRDRIFGGDASPRRAAEAFAAAWQKGDLTGVTWDGSDQRLAATTFTALTAGMASTGSVHPNQVTTGVVTRSGSDATAVLRVAWRLTQDVQWRYGTSLHLHEVAGAWRVVLDAATVAPHMAPGQVLSATTKAAPRADVLGADGARLVTDRPTVDVGIEPRRSTDLARTVARTVAVLASAAVQVDGSGLLIRAKASAPDAFVSVVTLREAVYKQLKSRLQPISGTVFATGLRSLAPSANFARALLGSVGPATQEVIQKSGGTLKASDMVGLSGLEAQFQSQLAGQAGVIVRAVTPTRARSGSAASPAPVEDRVLFQVDPKAGKPLSLTLDPAIQAAADAALATVTKPSALVVVRVSTGAVLAVANGGPGGAAGYDRALLGRYPPGSTFKIASGLALLRQGLTTTEQVDCPPSVTVDGKTFKNAEQEQLGPVPFSTDFARSCNTAFIGSAGKVSPQQLTAAAHDLGYRMFSLGTPTSDAQTATSTDPVGHAAAMIGQGQVLASPLNVAVSAASVAAGKSLTPYLLADRPPPPASPLDAGQVAALRTLMRGVITSGTGSALAKVPGTPVSGKTGTAEYGSAVPPRTHAWFAGFQGDIAFAVLVEDGGFGATAAAPLAAALLTDLAAKPTPSAG